MIVSDPSGRERLNRIRYINETMPYMNEGVLLCEANPFLQPWVDFAKLMKERVKLFNRALILWAKVSLGPDRTAEEYEKMFKDYQSEAESIKKNIATMEQGMKKYWSEELSLLMWANPGEVIGLAIVEEMVQFPLDVLSGQNNSWTKKFGQEMGLNNLPVVGRIFTDPPAGCMFIGANYLRGPEAASDEYFRCMMLERESTRQQANGYTSLFNNIQRLFTTDYLPEGKAMDVNSMSHTRRILIEGGGDEEFTLDGPDPKDIDPQILAKSMLKVMEEAGVFTEIEQKGEELLTAKQKLVDGVLDPILAKVETGSELAAAATFEEFQEAIESKKSMFPDLGKLDLTGYSQSLDKSLEDIRKDPKKWAEMVELAKKQLGDLEEGKTDPEKDPDAGQAPEGESNEESAEQLPAASEDKLLAFARRMIFQETKSEVQQTLVEQTEDSYEHARKMITEGLSSEGMAMLDDTAVGKKHLALIQESMEKLEQAFTKLKNMK